MTRDTVNRVIGGEFTIDSVAADRGLRTGQVRKNGFPGLGNWSSPFCRYYASGRTALFAILQCIIQTQIGYALLPDFLCESITQTVIDSGMSYDFYHVGGNLLPDDSLLEQIDKSCSTVLLINYFGMLNLKSTVAKIRETAPNAYIILDDVQNLYSFSNETDCDFAFTSFRKWLPVPDGAAVYTNNEKMTASLNDYTGSNTFAQYKFAGNLLKSYADYIDENIMLELIERGEKNLDKNYCCPMSEISRGLLQGMDINSFAATRRRNAAELHKGLTNANIHHIYTEDAVPLFVPIFLDVEQRAVVRKNLFEKNMFCPIHWPWKGKTLCGANQLYDTELSLICDQRYSIDDMKRIVETVYDSKTG